MSETVIDARGMRCPWPAIRVARAARDGANTILVHTDDPAAPAELEQLAKARLGVIEHCGNATFRLRF